MSVECFYSKSTKLQLPFSELREEVKAAKGRNAVTYAQSKDPCIKNAIIKIDAGTKANTDKGVKEAISNLKMKEIAGIGNKGREGLGLVKRKYFSTSTKVEQRTMVVKEIRDSEENRRMVKIVGLAQQGASTKWEVPPRKISHEELIRTSETRLKFLVKSVHDLLPTPTNKNRWYGTEDKCKLCGEEGTLNHILSGCKIALAQGRYKYRHDKVLKELSKTMEEQLKTANKNQTRIKSNITFIKEGEKKPIITNNKQNSYLDTAQDWKMSVDLEGRLKIPSEITVTNLRPDMILISKDTKQLGIIELTVPIEDRIEISGEIKRNKYSIIEEEGKANGWGVQIWAVEIGCRGFPAKSTKRLLKQMGLNARKQKECAEKLGKIAEEASRNIWRWSHNKKWF